MTKIEYLEKLIDLAESEEVKDEVFLKICKEDLNNELKAELLEVFKNYTPEMLQETRLNCYNNLSILYIAIPVNKKAVRNELNKLEVIAGLIGKDSLSIVLPKLIGVLK